MKNSMFLFVSAGLIISVAFAQEELPLHRAVMENDLKKVEEILAKEPKAINQTDKDGLTPLHHAASKMSFSVALGSNATGTATTVAQDTPPAVAALLIKKGADVNAVDKTGLTPLLLATRNNNPPLAKLLVERGAKVNVSRSKGPEPGFTPLHLAVFHDDASLVETFLRKGARVNAKAENGQTPSTQQRCSTDLGQRSF